MPSGLSVFFLLAAFCFFSMKAGEQNLGENIKQLETSVTLLEKFGMNEMTGPIKEALGALRMAKKQQDQAAAKEARLAASTTSTSTARPTTTADFAAKSDRPDIIKPDQPEVPTPAII